MQKMNIRKIAGKVVFFIINNVYIWDFNPPSGGMGGNSEDLDFFTLQFLSIQVYASFDPL